MKVISESVKIKKPFSFVNKKIKITYLIDGKPNRQEIKDSIKNRRIFSLIKEVFKAVKILIMKKRRTIKANNSCYDK